MHPHITVLTLLMLFTTYSNSEPANFDGKVEMKGHIYDSACTIDTGSLDQTVSMGNTAIHELLEHGIGPNKSFSIKLIDCDFGKNPNGVKGDLGITFDGPRDGDIFMVSGDASGVGLTISSETQDQIVPGQIDKLMRNEIHVENNFTVLTYHVQLVKLSNSLISGDYYTTLSFKLDYN